jgi:hypothetical protein
MVQMTTRPSGTEKGEPLEDHISQFLRQELEINELIVKAVTFASC